MVSLCGFSDLNASPGEVNRTVSASGMSHKLKVPVPQHPTFPTTFTRPRSSCAPRTTPIYWRTVASLAAFHLIGGDYHVTGAWVCRELGVGPDAANRFPCSRHVFRRTLDATVRRRNLLPWPEATRDCSMNWCPERIPFVCGSLGRPGDLLRLMSCNGLTESCHRYCPLPALRIADLDHSGFSISPIASSRRGGLKAQSAAPGPAAAGDYRRQGR